MPKDSEVISFRCPVYLCREIDRARTEGQSRSEFVRTLLDAHFVKSEEPTANQQFACVRGQLDALGLKIDRHARTQEKQRVAPKLRHLIRLLRQTAYWTLTDTTVEDDEARRKIERIGRRKRRHPR